jgi:membrane fusion protein, multidrug efflux system
MAMRYLLLLGAAVITTCVVPQGAKAEEKTARGVVRSLAEVTISVDYSARIKSIPALEGQSFQPGDTLISFDCDRFRAELMAARAHARAEQLVYANNRKLLDRGAIGANEVRVSQAQSEKAQAEAAAVQARIVDCTFKAPFEGRMVERMAQEFEIPAANQPLVRIVDMSRLEVEVILPSKWLMWMREGEPFRFKIDETDELVEATVKRLGSTVDPVSQTIKVYGVITNNKNSILPGMSGTAMFGSQGS